MCVFFILLGKCSENEQQAFKILGPEEKKSFQSSKKDSNCQQKERIVSRALCQATITSYLPKMKTKNYVNDNTQSKKRDGLFSSSSSIQEARSMSLMERETTKKTIFSAKTVACTIVYSDGSTLLHPKSHCTEVINIVRKTHDL